MTKIFTNESKWITRYIPQETQSYHKKYPRKEGIQTTLKLKHFLILLNAKKIPLPGKCAFIFTLKSEDKKSQSGKIYRRSFY